MPLQNRVTPDGSIIACVERGTMMGNRGGCLHGDDRRLGERRWVSKQWICCVLAFNGRHRQVMAPRRYTELFFLDEATALAAGHRPCFECRRAEANRFAAVWGEANGLGRPARAAEIDVSLHAERLILGGEKRVGRARLGLLPDATFVRAASDAAPALLLDGRLMAWSPGGYSAAEQADPGRIVTTLTPPSIIAALKSGYRPQLHESSRALR